MNTPEYLGVDNHASFWSAMYLELTYPKGVLLI